MYIRRTTRLLASPLTDEVLEKRAFSCDQWRLLTILVVREIGLFLFPPMAALPMIALREKYLEKKQMFIGRGI